MEANQNNKKSSSKIILWIGLAMVLGVVIGAIFPYNVKTEGEGFDGTDLKILSTLFMRMIKMILGPLVLSMLVVGIAKLGDVKAVGRLGLATLGYFYFATILSLITGLAAVNILQPGASMELELPKVGLDTGIEAKKMTLDGFLTHLIPQSVFEALATNEILQIVIFSIFLGIAIAGIGTKGEILTKGLDALSHAMFKVVGYVMTFAPLGVLGSMASVIAKQGLGILTNYIYLIACFFGALLFFIFVLLWGICILAKIDFLKLLGEIKDAVILTFSTASSEASMPQTIEALQKFGCSQKIISFVLPLGYSFNLDGSMIYMTFATAFIAQAYGIHLSFTDQIVMMLTLLLTSKGIAGVPRASLVIIAGTMSMFNLPPEGLGLLLGIDQILDMGRSATSVVGNAVATAVIDKWNGKEQVTEPI
ncbi:MAG: dicarboxylate/amino acid:cation symporter [Leadbetterella sp.]